ncbi:hypothetical protein AVEN_245605-1 [Araneus ventricosus]|uniref:Uncharacterized protein n=1 Tax=Araneus ventricosus TaxID=182803 RepID=A0A4Y2IVF7_ARAVE|nr:hypothetical protein AVEN_245605-1 [Araneus ventricosus]
MTRTTLELAPPSKLSHHTSAPPSLWTLNRMVGKPGEIYNAYSQGRLQGCAGCAVAQGDERVGAPIPNHEFENSLVLYGCRLELNGKESKSLVYSKSFDLIKSSTKGKP